MTLIDSMETMANDEISDYPNNPTYTGQTMSGVRYILTTGLWSVHFPARIYSYPRILALSFNHHSRTKCHRVVALVGRSELKRFLSSLYRPLTCILILFKV